jgi:ubiquitin C-terminal hydrolase
MLSPFEDHFPIQQQHDVEEWLGALLGGLEADLKACSCPNIVSELFDGEYAEQLSCPGCGNGHVTPVPSRVISLPLPPWTSTIQSCLEHLSCQEQLDADNQWNCPTCNCAVRAWKRIFLAKLPKCLILHLKRHVRTHAGIFKSATKITFPPILEVIAQDPAKGSLDTVQYQLKAVAEHMNQTCPTDSGHGHYVAYVSVGSLWYLCNDASVRGCSLDDVLRAEPYMLFYERVDK